MKKHEKLPEVFFLSEVTCKILLAMVMLLFQASAIAQTTSAEFHLKVTLFESNHIHIIWQSQLNATDYYVEKSLDNQNWSVIATTSASGLVDITTLSASNMPDAYQGIMYSTESGAGFIKNEIINDNSTIGNIRYRIRAKFSNNSSVTTNPASVFVEGQPNPSSSNSSMLGPNNCTLDNTTGFTLWSPFTQQTVITSCCTEIQTKFYKAEFTYYTPVPNCPTLATVQNDCHLPLSPTGSDCTHNNLYDPCCEHIGCAYGVCKCQGVIAGTAIWNPCNPVTYKHIYWLTTQVTPFYPTLAITGFDVTCLSNNETYCATPGLSNYQWSVPSSQGTITGASNQACVVIHWLTTGTHTVTVSAVVCGSTSNTATLNVTVVNSTSPNFTVSPGTSFCAGTNVCFTPYGGLGTQESEYDWYVNGVNVNSFVCSGNGGACGGQCAQLQYSFPGSNSGIQYNVSLQILDYNTGLPSACNFPSMTVTSYSQPSSDFTIPSGCLSVNQLFNFSAFQAPFSGLTYTWDFDGAVIASGNTQFVNGVSWASCSGRENLDRKI